MIDYYDLAIAWSWQYDSYFISRIEKTLQNCGLKTYRIEHHNISESLNAIKKGYLRFSYFFDRASDTEEEFLPLVHYFEKSKTRVFNPGKLSEISNDKATMHLEFITAGINVPYTIIISPYNSESDAGLSLKDLAILGRPFIVKPANNTGGGMGVVTGAESLLDILETRQHQKDDKYLIQEKIIPKIIDGKRAWFRCFFAFGKTILSWWDDDTHRYRTVTKEDENKYKLYRLRRVMSIIRKVCMLDFFSSEIAITDSEKLIVIDYVNDICDMRPQSSAYDGVPDQLIDIVINRLAYFIKMKKQ
jgi:hypothetical protein